MRCHETDYLIQLELADEALPKVESDICSERNCCEPGVCLVRKLKAALILKLLQDAILDL